MRKALAIISLLALSGCAASQLQTLKTLATLPTSGKTVDVITVDAAAPAGMNTRGEYLFDEQGNLLASHMVGNEGILTGFFRSGFEGVAIGTGIGLGAKAIGRGLNNQTTKVVNQVP